MRYHQLKLRLRSYATLNNGVLLVAFLIAATWAWGTIGAIQRNFTLQQKVDELSQEVAVAELENKTLGFHKQYFESNEYLELSAREHLNKAAPGEKLLILPPNTVESKASDQLGSTDTPITQRSNFAQWMYFLFGQKNNT